jgi:bud site selection protein 31
MPRLKRSKKGPPEGFEVLQETLDELDLKMREAESETHEGKRKKEALWPIFRIHHQRSRYVYEMYYKYKAISKEVYQYCLDEKIGDADLIAKWKKNGYEKLCCLACISSKDTAFGGTCICRVPMADRPNSKPIECSSCGCLGCASGD